MEQISSYPWPDMGDPARIVGLRKLAEQYRNEGYAVVLKDPFAGIFEMAQRLMGFERLLVMMVDERRLCAALFNKLCALKLAFWEMALPRLGDVVDVVSQTDDYGSQSSMLISPTMYRLQIKPLWKAVIARYQGTGTAGPHIFSLLREHSSPAAGFHRDRCGDPQPGAHSGGRYGASRTEARFRISIDILGGGVDTQGVLPYGSPKDVRDDVRRNIDTLAPGGGFVFNQVHNIQADAPVENLLAMWEALEEYGIYGRNE